MSVRDCNGRVRRLVSHTSLTYMYILENRCDPETFTEIFFSLESVMEESDGFISAARIVLGDNRM